MKMSVRLVAALLLLFALLGVQRTPEAQVGEAIGVVVTTAVAVGGCAYLVTTLKPETPPVVTQPSPEHAP